MKYFLMEDKLKRNSLNWLAKFNLSNHKITGPHTFLSASAYIFMFDPLSASAYIFIIFMVDPSSGKKVDDYKDSEPNRPSHAKPI